MSVTARFYVGRVEEFPGSTASNVSMGAVCRGAHNSEWASATPSGSIQMTIRNDQATAQFVAGKEYEVTFRRVEPPTPGDGHAAKRYVNSSGWVSCGECGAQPQLPQGYVYGPTGELPEDQLDWAAHDEMFAAS